VAIFVGRAMHFFRQSPLVGSRFSQATHNHERLRGAQNGYFPNPLEAGMNNEKILSCNSICSRVKCKQCRIHYILQIPIHTSCICMLLELAHNELHCTAIFQMIEETRQSLTVNQLVEYTVASEML